MCCSRLTSFYLKKPGPQGLKEYKRSRERQQTAGMGAGSVSGAAIANILSPQQICNLELDDTIMQVHFLLHFLILHPSVPFFTSFPLFPSFTLFSYFSTSQFTSYTHISHFHPGLLWQPSFPAADISRFCVCLGQ